MKRIPYIDPKTCEVSLKVPAPRKAKDFRFLLSWNALEHESGQMPSESEHNRRYGSMLITLTHNDNEHGPYIFKGKRDEGSHPSKHVSITQGDHGFEFNIVCLNKNACLTNYVFWSKYLSRKELSEVIWKADNEARIKGYFTTNGNDSILYAQLTKAGDLESVSIEISQQELDAFRERLVEEEVLLK